MREKLTDSHQDIVNELNSVEQELRQIQGEKETKQQQTFLWWQAERRTRALQQRERYLRSLIIPNLCA